MPIEHERIVLSHQALDLVGFVSFDKDLSTHYLYLGVQVENFHDT